MGFFDKLKGGIGVSEEEEKPQKGQNKKKDVKKIIKKEESAPESKPRESVPPKIEKKSQSEGQLAIDVYETDDGFVIQSTIAGVKPEDLEITVENDMVTVKGSREKQTEEVGEKYYYQECYWGTFSRQVILPEEVDGSKAEAKMKDGVLTLKVPKIRKIQKRKITVQQIE